MSAAAAAASAAAAPTGVAAAAGSFPNPIPPVEVKKDACPFGGVVVKRDVLRGRHYVFTDAKTTLPAHQNVYSYGPFVTVTKETAQQSPMRECAVYIGRDT